MTEAMSAMTRRRLLAASLAAGAFGAQWALADESTSAAPALATMIRHPLLVASLYRHKVSDAYASDGAAGVNRDSYRYIEEQRQGAEWIVRGLAEGDAGWVALGWRILDWGVARQQPDGGFGSGDAFHSTSFFVEALSRACILDPTGANEARLSCLRRGAAWLTSPSVEPRGAASNAPYTHRRFILAAALGQAAELTSDATLARRAAAWAREGLALQTGDGTDPERGGFDAGYQMVGVLFALRYLCGCADAALRASLREGVRRATKRELTRLAPDGSIDATGSTRIEIEKSRAGKVKDVPYGEFMQALVFGAQALPEPAWLEPAERIGRARGWFRA